MRRLNRFDLNLLQIFDAVYRRGGVSAAARHLHLSQSAVSHALARLRATFNDPLFVRQGNRLVPTPFARAMTGPVAEALGNLDAALFQNARFDPAVARRDFRIGVRLSGEAPRFSAIALRVLAEAPHAGIASVTFRRRELVSLLAGGELDLALDVALPPDDRLCRTYLGAGPLVVVARPDHPCLDMPFDLANYLAQRHVVATGRPHGPAMEDLILENLGLSRRVAVRCQHAITAWQIVAASDCLFTLPRAHAEVLHAIWPMRLLDAPLPAERSSSYLYWHQTAQADPALSWLRAIIVQELQEDEATTE